MAYIVQCIMKNVLEKGSKNFEDNVFYLQKG